MANVAVLEQSGELAAADPLEAFADFLRLRVAEGDAAADTIRAYWAAIRYFYRWAQAEGVQPAEATENDVVEYRRAMVERGLAASTINLRLSALRRFFGAAVWRGWRHDNPAEGLKARRDRAAIAEGPQYLTQGQLGALFHAAKGNSLQAMRDRLVLALGALQGLRCVEICRLSTNDVMERGGHPVLYIQGKTGARLVYLRPDMVALLEAYMAAKTAAGLTDEALVVSLANGSRGQRLTRGGIAKLVVRYLDAIGVRGRTNSTHLLRHSYATITLAAGAEMRQVQESLGHADPRTTARYAHATDRAQRNPALFIEEVDVANG